jgi:hypothetical protein
MLPYSKGTQAAQLRAENLVAEGWASLVFEYWRQKLQAGLVKQVYADNAQARKRQCFGRVGHGSWPES